MTETGRENRAHPRRRTFKQGLVSFQNDEITIPCLVRDESEGGAKLEFSDPVRLPQSFFLTIPVEAAKFPAEIEWARGKTLGVRFTGPAMRSSIRHYQHLVADRPGTGEPVAPRPQPAAIAPAPVEPQQRPAAAKPFGRRK